jgi:hypothetical protein
MPGVNLILLGLVCFVAGLLFDGGFIRGLFNGATIALMVLGAYVIGANTWGNRRAAKGGEDSGPWLPSRDESR